MNLARIFLLACLGFLPLSLQADCTRLDDLAWIAGGWVSEAGGYRTSENWTRISEDTAEGVGEVHVLESGELRSRESLRLVSMAGGIFYIAKVAHNELPVAFRLAECTDELAAFVNPGHDFPTRIAYNRLDDGAMRVDVSGPDGKGFSIPYKAAIPAARKRIALTFDDAPRDSSRHFTGLQRTRALIDALESVNAPPAMFFSTTRRLEIEGRARMRMYSLAGHHIGNHTHSHRRIDSMGVDAYIADIRLAHGQLERYPTFVPFFRFPFLDEGRDAQTRDRLRAALEEMGYRNGYVTVDNYDFYMDAVFQRALEQGREVDEQRLGKAYVEALMASVRFYDGIAARHLDHEPVHVLLLHENDLAALYVDDLVTALRAEGWTIVDALEAYQDPIAQADPDTLFNNQGRVAALAEVDGAKRRDLVHELEDTTALDRWFEKMGAFGAPYPWQPENSDLVFSSNREGNGEIYLLRSGESEWINLSRHEGEDNYPVWSPDGRRIAFQSRRGGNLDIFVMNDDGTDLVRLTDHEAHDYLPSWTPDGKAITFLSWRREPGETEDRNHFYIVNIDGTGLRRFLVESPGASTPIEWSPAGTRGAVTRKTGDTQFDLFLTDETGKVSQRLTEDALFNGTPSFSPVGGRLAFYADDRQGTSRLETILPDGSGRRTVVSGGQNWHPRWSPDGCWLVYTAASGADTSNLDIRAIRADGSGEWRALVTGPGREGEASWRPELPPELTCD